MKHKEHLFGPGETIHAIVKKYNHQNMTDLLLTKLMQEFNTINDNAVPTVGVVMKIPIFTGFVGMPQTELSYDNLTAIKKQ